LKLGLIIAEKKLGIISVPSDVSVKVAAGKLTEYHIGALLVTDPSGLTAGYIGIITDGDIIKCCSKEDILGNIKVEKIMTRNMIVATVNDNTSYITNVMSRHKIGHIPVIEKNKIVGIISMSDMIRTLHQEDEIKIHHLSDFCGTYRNEVF
jgi:signal-transduction protein with cAMP-binding, CBS, and nucleotidyltransferase domain